MRASLFVSIQAVLWMDVGVGVQGFVPGAPRMQMTKLNMMGKEDGATELGESVWENAANLASRVALGGLLSASLIFGGPAWAENELSDKYGGAGLDTSLVDQNCLIDKCSLQAKACLADDPSCRKGLTCTAKCLGDNACITGCMARYGNNRLDNFLKCTIEDNECIKIAILEGGADEYGKEPRAPARTLANFKPQSLEGSWYKVVGWNQNYDCYMNQRNSFAVTNNPEKLQMDVEFSMPHLMPDGSQQQSSLEFVSYDKDGSSSLPQSIGLNAYHTKETMVFDKGPVAADSLKWEKGANEGMTYARTAHSEGEMFGLKFWENWYVLGENDPGTPEFKFIYYNGKTRQNTYEGAFVYSRTKELAPESMKKVYQIARDAGMKPNEFCRIRNDFDGAPDASAAAPANNAFRGILASTKVSEILGVEPVAARDMIRQDAPTARELQPVEPTTQQRAWWYEVGDYLENPHRHFQTMNKLRAPMEWPQDVLASYNSNSK